MASPVMMMANPGLSGDWQRDLSIVRESRDHRLRDTIPLASVPKYNSPPGSVPIPRLDTRAMRVSASCAVSLDRMEKLGFWIPVTYGKLERTLCQIFLESADDYFYFGGDRAHVDSIEPNAASQMVCISKDSVHWCEVALKILSMLTLVIPVVMFVAKIACRTLHSFHHFVPIGEGANRLPSVKSAVI